MKIIKGQIVASTSIDAHGDKLTKEQLFFLFMQIPQEFILNQQHDLSKPPIGRIYNKRFVEISDREFAIKVDVDVFDEELFEEMRSFSISYTGERLTLNPSSRADIEILFNPLIFSREDMLSLIKISDETIQIDAIELKQKALEPITVLILKFVLISAAIGFFGKLGSDVYDVLKAKLRQLANRRKVKRKPEIILQLLFTIKLVERSVDVIIELLMEDLDIIKQRDLSIESALEYVTTATGHTEIQRVALRVQRSEPYWSLVYFVDLKGTVMNL